MVISRENDRPQPGVPRNEDGRILLSRKENTRRLVELLGADHPALRIPLAENKVVISSAPIVEPRKEYQLTMIDALGAVLFDPAKVAQNKKRQRQFADAVVAKYNTLNPGAGREEIGLPQNLDTPAELVAAVLAEQRPGDLMASNKHPWSEA